MNDSQNEKNDINKRPIYTIRRATSDIESAVLGGIIGGVFLFIGIFIIFKNLLIGLFCISISIFPICEIFRGIISLNNKSIISNSSYMQSEELRAKVELNDKRLKQISKIKIIGFLLTILIIVIAIAINW